MLYKLFLDLVSHLVVLQVTPGCAQGTKCSARDYNQCQLYAKQAPSMLDCCLSSTEQVFLMHRLMSTQSSYRSQTQRFFSGQSHCEHDTVDVTICVFIVFD